MDTNTNDVRVPPTIDEIYMETIWAREQYEMNPRDRQAASYELHGVESRYDMVRYENPNNLNQALLKFDDELNNPGSSSISAKLKETYNRALSLNSSYVTSSDFRLMFLRSEFFQITKAVIRFCKCLNILVKYFGEISLLRQLLLSDLSKRELKLLKEGSMQLSQSRDSLGRRPLFLLGNCGGNYCPGERDRVGLYLIFQVLAEDVISQQNGLVTIHLISEDVYQGLGGAENIPKMARLYLSIFEACPLRFSAIHFCFPKELIYRLLKPLLLFAIGEMGRKVLKIHSGTSVEWMYSLSSFGVRSDDVPTTYSGTVKTRQHMRWIKVRSAMDKYIEDQATTHVDGDYCFFYASKIKPFPHIQCPEINCVLFHNNGVAWEFPGNIKFRAFLDQAFSDNHEYTKHISNTEEDILNRIIRLALLRHFQFLLHDDINHWYDRLTEPEQLRRYIGFAYRGHLRRCSARRHRNAGDILDAEGKKSKDVSDYDAQDMDLDADATKPTRQQTSIFINMDGNQRNVNRVTNCCMNRISL